MSVTHLRAAIAGIALAGALGAAMIALPAAAQFVSPTQGGLLGNGQIGGQISGQTVPQILIGNLTCQTWEPQEFRPRVRVTNNTANAVPSGRRITVRSNGQSYQFVLGQTLAAGGYVDSQLPYHIYMQMGASCTALASA